MSMHSLKSSELSSESELLLKYCISVCVCDRMLHVYVCSVFRDGWIPGSSAETREPAFVRA